MNECCIYYLNFRKLTYNTRADALKRSNPDSEQKYKAWDFTASLADESVGVFGGSKIAVNALLVKASVGIDPATGKEVFVMVDGYTSDYNKAAFTDCGDMMPKNIGNFGLNAEFFGVGVHATFTWDRGSGSMMFNNTWASRCDGADEHFNFDRRLVKYGRWTKPRDVSVFVSKLSEYPGAYSTRSCKSSTGSRYPI